MRLDVRLINENVPEVNHQLVAAVLFKVLPLMGKDVLVFDIQRVHGESRSVDIIVHDVYTLCHEEDYNSQAAEIYKQVSHASYNATAVSVTLVAREDVIVVRGQEH